MSIEQTVEIRAENACNPRLRSVLKNARATPKIRAENVQPSA